MSVFLLHLVDVLIGGVVGYTAARWAHRAVMLRTKQRLNELYGKMFKS